MDDFAVAAAEEARDAAETINAVGIFALPKAFARRCQSDGTFVATSVEHLRACVARCRAHLSRPRRRAGDRKLEEATACAEMLCGLLDGWNPDDELPAPVIDQARACLLAFGFAAPEEGWDQYEEA